MPCSTWPIPEVKGFGSIEEYFISQLEPGDAFWFCRQTTGTGEGQGHDGPGKDTKKLNARIPSYMGGRLPLSSQMSEVLRMKNESVLEGRAEELELQA